MGLSVGSRVTMYATAFLCRVSISILLSTTRLCLSGFGATFTFLVIDLCTYSAGEAIRAIKFKAFMRRFKLRCSMLTSNMMGMVGTFLWVIARLFKAEWKSRPSILIGKTLLGIWAGGGKLIQHAYLVEDLALLLLSPLVEILSASSRLIFAGGLVLGYAVFSLPQERALGPSLNKTLLPGIFVLLSLLVWFILYKVDFNEDAEWSATGVAKTLTQARAVKEKKLIPI